jgi:hypothetical protein
MLILIELNDNASLLAWNLWPILTLTTLYPSRYLPIVCSLDTQRFRRGSRISFKRPGRSIHTSHTYHWELMGSPCGSRMLTLPSSSSSCSSTRIHRAPTGSWMRWSLLGLWMLLQLSSQWAFHSRPCRGTGLLQSKHRELYIIIFARSNSSYFVPWFEKRGPRRHLESQTLTWSGTESS